MKLAIKVKPQSHQDRVLGNMEGELHLEVRAGAIDGKANEAVIALLSKMLKIPKSKIAITRGQSSRHKLIEISDEFADQVNKAGLGS